MDYKVIILGSGAATGVPSLCAGWLDCNPNNPKNRRQRTSVYIDYKGTKILIDTSPDIRDQLIDNNIRDLDGVLYTHIHADHLLGIDYLREINRIKKTSLNFYTGPYNVRYIKKSFSYLIGHFEKLEDLLIKPSLIPNVIRKNKPFYINDLKITPIEMLGHSSESLGYIFNDGEMAYISDFKEIDEKAFKYIKKQPELLIIPLTSFKAQIRHASFEKVMEYIDKIGAKKVIINHMAGECDYDIVKSKVPENVYPAFDNMVIEF